METAFVTDMQKREEYYIDLVNTSLEGYLCEHGLPQQEVVDAMRYSLLSGGKRVRAVLLLEFCRLCGGSTDAALPFACAVEMLHCYSLIHDDLPCMDDDDLRRGKPSCHIRFGEATALLAGDALLTLAFETMLCGSPDAPPAPTVLRAAGILAGAAGYRGMVGGQVLDLACEGTHPDEEALLRIHRLKTAALIRAACTMGCVLACAGQAQIAAADAYAVKIGLSFQIVDDILDIVGSTEQLGKPTGSDSTNGKDTLAARYGVEETYRIARQLAKEAKDELRVFELPDHFLNRYTDMLTGRTH